MKFDQVRASLEDGGTQLCQLSGDDNHFASIDGENPIYLQCQPGYSARIDVSKQGGSAGMVTYTTLNGGTFEFATTQVEKPGGDSQNEPDNRTYRAANNYGC